jgi:hypothetical protein
MDSNFAATVFDYQRSLGRNDHLNAEPPTTYRGVPASDDAADNSSSSSDVVTIAVIAGVILVLVLTAVLCSSLSKGRAGPFTTRVNSNDTDSSNQEKNDDQLTLASDHEDIEAGDDHVQKSSDETEVAPVLVVVQ